MHFEINFKLKVNIICIEIVKWYFLRNKKNVRMTFNHLWNRENIFHCYMQHLGIYSQLS